MKFLLTNDDGIKAPGLWASARVLSKLGVVLIVAPARNHSGYGAALPAARSLNYITCPGGPDGEPLPNVTAYGLDGTPAACAQVGLSGVLGHGPFDLVVSGVNAGLNMGCDVFYSGTVGAALTAQLLGVPAVAVSLDAEPGQAAHWETAQWALDEAIKLWQGQPEQEPCVFNVNVPDLPTHILSGIQLTRFSRHSFLGNHRFVVDDAHPYTLSAVEAVDRPAPEPEVWTDAWAVRRGYVSVTPLRPFPDLAYVVPINRMAVRPAAAA